MIQSVDDKELRQWVVKLNKLKRSAYPLAIRGTLNDLAFRSAKIAKTSTLPNKFNLRNNYIQTSVRIEKSVNIFNVGQMESTVGQAAMHRGKHSDQLKKQESGGQDKPKKKYLKTPLNAARVGGSYAKGVSARNTIKALDSEKIENKKDLPSNVAIASALRKPKGVIMFTSKKGNRIIARFKRNKNTIKKDKTVKSGKMKLEILYRLDKKRTNKPTHWLKQTTDIASNATGDLFIKQAKRQQERIMGQFKK